MLFRFRASRSNNSVNFKKTRPSKFVGLAFLQATFNNLLRLSSNKHVWSHALPLYAMLAVRWIIKWCFGNFSSPQSNESNKTRCLHHFSNNPFVTPPQHFVWREFWKWFDYIVKVIRCLLFVFGLVFFWDFPLRSFPTNSTMANYNKTTKCSKHFYKSHNLFIRRRRAW